MPLPRHDRSQTFGDTVVGCAVVVDGLTRISSRTEGEGAEMLCLGRNRSMRPWYWSHDDSTASQDLVDPVHRSVRASFTNTDADDAIQECVRFRRGLESGQRSKVVAMTQPLKSHVDQRMIVCLQRNAQVQLHYAVGAQQQPVTSSRQNLAAQPRAYEVASRDRDDAANAVGYRPELLGRSGGDSHRHQWSRRHGGLSLARHENAVVGVGILRESGEGCGSGCLEHVPAPNAQG